MDSDNKTNWVFHFFISKETPKTNQVIAILEEICEIYFDGQCDLRVIDVLQDPAACIRENIIATPTLLKKHPEPVQRIIGDLSNKELLLSVLDIQIET